MNLLYIWNENYMVKKTCQQRGFLLNSKYDIEYKSLEKKMTIRKNESYIEGFWGQNIFDTMAIIGENGSGKTMLLNYIIELISNIESVNMINYDFVIAFEHDGVIKIYTTENMIDSSENVDSSDIATEIIYVKRESAERDILMTYRIGYFTNALSLADYRSPRHGYITDASLGAMIRNCFKNDYEMHYVNLSEDKIVNYFGYEFLNVIKFIYSYEAKRMDGIIHWPEFVRIKVNSYRTNEEYIIAELRKMKFKNQEMQQVVNAKTFNLSNYLIHIEACKEDKVVKNLLMNLIINLFKEFCIPQISGERNKVNYSQIFLEQMKQFKQMNYDVEEDIYVCIINFIQNVKNKLAKNEYHKNIFEKYIQFIIWIKDNKEYIYQRIQKYDGSLSFPINSENKENVIQLVEMYERTNFPFPYLYFELGLSTGEFDFIRLFSDIYSMIENGIIYNNTSAGRLPCDNVLLIFDEADLSLHPRWQQEYISLIMKFIECIIKKCSVQIIIATHSPIMLSDFPKNNVIYLEEKNETTKRNFETFGCNIHNLFLDSFFLDENGTIGRFAEEKINAIAETIARDSDYSDYKSEDMLKTIDIIGDDLIKDKLLEMYNQSKKKEFLIKKHDVNENTIRSTIEILQSQKRQLEQMIVELEKKIHD